MKTAVQCSSVCILVLLLLQPLWAANYRSRAGGDWALATSWQTLSGSTWVTASVPPGAADVVTIRSNHTIVIATSDAFANALTVDAGGSLLLSASSFELTISNGNAGADFVVNGFFQDNGSSSNGLNLAGGATWQLGANATFVKSNNSSASVYRDNYHNGMQSIPPSANWIIRRISGDVTFTTIGTYYPNLTFESESGHWNPALGASRFQGAAGTAEILGNLDVGGNGGGSVTLYNENTSISPVTIYGACIIRPGSTLTNAGTLAGTGFNIVGSLIIDGTFNVTAGSGMLRFSGGSTTVSGSGLALINQIEVQLSDAVYLQRSLNINNDLLLLSGKVVLTQFDLSVGGNIIGASNNRYVQTLGFGALSMPVNGSQYFPVGNNSFNPAILQQGGGQVKIRVEDLVRLEGLSGNPVTNHVVSRTWHLSGAVSAGANLTVQWNAADEWPGFNRGACYVSQYHNGWQQDNAGQAGGGGPFLRSRAGIIGPGAYAIASSGVLPVNLAWFQANNIGKKVVLEWLTLQEDQNNGFIVERSNNGSIFEAIGFVQGAGSTIEQRIYHFEDLAPLPDWSYYRLQQLDFNGDSTFSPLVVVFMELTEQANVIFYPNPATDCIHIKWGKPLSGNCRALVYDKNGKLLMQQHLEGGATTLPLFIQSLPSGQYHLFIQTDDEPLTCSFLKI